MQPIRYFELDANGMRFVIPLAVMAGLILIGLGSAYYMEHHGHIVTGMNNQIVWGTPHVFAIFLIVAASGALNAASVASVFNQNAYKPLARLSALVAIGLLVGGLAILVLDLGRPDRLTVAMSTYNFKSIFAWNIFLYNGFLAIVAVYIWLMMEPPMRRYSKIAGYAAFIWRLILTTGTGAIFGFIVAREAYDSAMLPPLFVIMSFAYGMAVFMLVLMGLFAWIERPIGDYLLRRLKNLLAVFVAAVLYFVAVFHITNFYATEHHDFERFILFGANGGGLYATIFWTLHILVGNIVPLVMLLHPRWGMSRPLIAAACGLILIGGISQLYVILIGGQAFPLEMFPGKEIITSGFQDGRVAPYTPSLWEILLGIGGIGIALAAIWIGTKVLRFLPESLDDSLIDPHYRSRSSTA